MAPHMQTGDRTMRKPIAMLITIVFIALWAVGAATIGSQITEWPQLAQLAFYVFAGVAWAFPLKPLMGWMNAPDADKPD